MNPWIQLLGSGGIAAIIIALGNFLAQRRNLGSQATRTDAEAQRTDAETDEIITNSARGLVAELRVELSRKDTRIAGLEERIDRLEQRETEQRRLLEIHSAWDFMATSKLRECKPPISFPQPPPLTVPRSHDTP